MAKRKQIIIVAFLILFIILFIPIPKGTYKDGGTKVFSALTYKIVFWNKLTDDGVYEKTKIYFLPDSINSIDELWLKESGEPEKSPDSETTLQPNIPIEEGVTYAKPVIYLYPEEKTDVTVKLSLNGQFTCTYPSYNNSWEVTASPDGTLTDKNGQTYSYLYWEGESFTEYDMSEGFCVKGEDTAEFLESALEKLGLNRREANEFIVYWLPLLEVNAYNIISFQNESYTDSAKLSVSPSPDTVIRVFMAWKASNSFVQLPEQKLTVPERNGFTVIEWGGTEIKG